LFREARAGSGHAWRSLVQRSEPRLRSIARSFRLPPPDIDDVLQETWLELLRDIDSVRTPDAIAGWLATVTRRRAMRRLQTAVREDLTDDVTVFDGADHAGPEAALLAAERRCAVRRAVAMLPGRHRALMFALLAEPDLGYESVRRDLGIPLGSIGPIRGRCLEQLARQPEIRALAGDTGSDVAHDCISVRSVTAL
jgi:RNA polymerase sigma factor (sigma-70 family)